MEDVPTKYTGIPQQQSDTSVTVHVYPGVYLEKHIGKKKLYYFHEE